MNWYGRTKLLSEYPIEDFVDDAFPAHLFLISNLYGEHEIRGERVSKATVTNFFVNRALAGETLTVYEPGTQARNYIHVKDVASAYKLSEERTVEELEGGKMGVEKYEIASDEDPSLTELAELVRDVTREERGIGVDVELVENPRGNETLVEEFAVNTTRAREVFGWRPTHTVESSIRELFE